MRALVLLALAAAAAAGAASDSAVTVNVGTDDEERAVYYPDGTSLDLRSLATNDSVLLALNSNIWQVGTAHESGLLYTLCS